MKQDLIKLSDNSTVWEVYPEDTLPEWVKVGTICNVIGEAEDKFIITEIGSRSVGLCTVTMVDGVYVAEYFHGREAFHKLKAIVNEREVDTQP